MKTRSFLLAAGVVLAMAFILSCPSDNDGKPDDNSSPGGYTGSVA